MTGGWGTPPGKPVLESIQETADRLRERAKAQPVANPQRVRLPGHPPYDVMTGRCADGYHDDCHGHLLGVPCCCDCHTPTEENTDDR